MSMLQPSSGGASGHSTCGESPRNRAKAVEGRRGHEEGAGQGGREGSRRELGKGKVEGGTRGRRQAEGQDKG